ncbi:hypothetical protein CTI12_AA487640 [Artemisia annua]|uniref:Uncharacterized protein n=1 Tax=Artemisia annua TaxID=35608 RepID=A0A2U1LIG2_ARTAN|nr:hypothetical protein CTI12_AA487640 [Artemisia annua]
MYLTGNTYNLLLFVLKKLDSRGVTRNSRCITGSFRRRYNHYKWFETRGVDEESLIQSLPKNLRRDIQRHLCLYLVKRVETCIESTQQSENHNGSQNLKSLETTLRMFKESSQPFLQVSLHCSWTFNAAEQGTNKQVNATYSSALQPKVQPGTLFCKVERTRLPKLILIVLLLNRFSYGW